MTDPFALQRFVDAQHPVIDRVLVELREERKRTHWMWFVFPQVKGLGTSPMAQRYALSGLDEARAYLDHAVLGLRLRTCTQLVLDGRATRIDDVFGPPDDLKFHASMTLFGRAAPAEPLFADALERFFAAAPHARTLALLG